MYDPSEIPQTSVEDLARAVTDELQRISEAFRIASFDSINLSERHVPLDKPRDGDVINADGTNYDPGSGKGIYYYNGSTYVKLG